MKHTLTRLTLTAYLMTLPFTAIAAGSVQVADSIAGLGANIRLSGFPPNANLSLDVETPEDLLTLSARTDARGEGVAMLGSAQTEAAGEYRVTVSSTGGMGGASNFEVMPDTVDTRMSLIRTLAKSIEADGSDQAVVVVSLSDRFGNPLAGRPVTLVSSRTDDMIETDASETDVHGEQHFYVSTMKEGTLTLRALDLLSGGVLQSSVTVTAGSRYAIGGNETTASRSRYVAQLSDFDIIDRFEITAPREMTAGEEAPKISVRAIDRDGNTVQDYLGTIRFDAPNDPDAVLPGLGRYVFKDADLGEKNFPITLKFTQPGEQTLRVEDEQDPTIYGETTIIVTGGGTNPAASDKILITSHEDGETVSSTSIILQGTGPRLTNLIVTGGDREEYLGDTDTAGRFSIPLTLDGSKPQATLRVRDDSGRYSSDPLILNIDTDGPEIEKVTLSPDDPVTNDKILVTVESEPSLPSVTVKLQGDEAVVLVETEDSPGEYKGFLTAPAEPGTYQPIVTATDAAGNSSEVRTMFEARKPGLPKVRNLRGEGKINSVSLQWDPVDMEIDEYRVYVGETPTDFLYSLDTGRDVTQATVAGLGAGKSYYFAVTALKGDDESPEKSDVFEARVLGLTLDITPQDSSLLVQWPELSTQLPLSSYLLEYGVEDGNYSEKRLINGELKAYTIRDLINGVTYFVQLTPVTITGDRLTDLAAKGEGTPNGSGFTPGASDPIPFDPDNLPPFAGGSNGGGGIQKPGNLNNSGVPDFLWWFAAAAGLGGAYVGWMQRQSRRHSAAFLRQIQAHYR